MNIHSNFDYLIKFALLGDSNVGKTNMIIRFIDNVFSLNTPSTIGYDCKTRIITIDKKKVKVNLWDTAGQEKYLSISKSFFQKIDGVMLVYDITKLESFKNVQIWIEMIKDYDDKMPVILVANKSDMEEKRIISDEEGKQLAKENNLKFFETSALNGNNIEKAFVYFSGEVLKYLKNDKKFYLDKFSLESHKSKIDKKKKCC
jgi:small GTP-binding protein